MSIVPYHESDFDNSDIVLKLLIKYLQSYTAFTPKVKLS